MPPRTIAAEQRNESRYWDDVADAWAARDRDRSWRCYADALHARWLAAWLPSTPTTYTLKTDAFEEVAGERGLYATLAASTRTVVSMDLSTAMLAHARRRYTELHPLCSSVERLPIRDGVFDVIVSTSTLDHLATLADVGASLAELRRVLRPGGRLMLTLDNRSNPVIWLRSVLPHRWLRRARVVPYETGANCGPARLAELAVAAGLELVSVGSLMHCPRLPFIVLCRALDRLASARVNAGFVRCMLALEALGRLPTRFVTANFVSLVATRPR